MNLSSDAFTTWSGIFIGGVWVFHGLYSKILNRIPRHRQIVSRILGPKIAVPATILIGTLEVALGVWVFSGEHRVLCASVQTLGLVAMNSLEIARARDLLISSVGMVFLNILFLALIWKWAL